MSKKWRLPSVVGTGLVLAGCAAVLGIDDVGYLLSADSGADAATDVSNLPDADAGCGAECQSFPVAFPDGVENFTQAIAVTNDALYVGHFVLDGPIVRFELDGGNPTVLARGYTSYFATARERLYYTTWDPGALWSMALDGGDLRTEATLNGGVIGLRLHHEGGHLIAYVGWYGEERGVWAVDLDTADGGTDLARPIGPRTNPAQITSDGARIFWASQNDAGVWTYDPDAGVATQLSATAEQPYGVAVHGDYVYFTERSNVTPRISRVHIDGGVGELVATFPRTTFPRELILSDGFLWVAAGSDIYRVSPGVDGGAPRSVARGLDTAQQLVADDDFIYWTEKGGRVQKLRKPTD